MTFAAIPAGAVSLPLTPTQTALLSESVAQPGQGVNVEQIVIRLDQNVPSAAQVRDAWAGAAARFECLRLTFARDGRGQFVQTCLPAGASDIAVQVLDWTGTDTAQALHAWLHADRTAGYDLSGTPPWRVLFARTGETRAIMVWSIHHAIIDLSGMARILDDLGQRLSGRAQPDAQGDQPLSAFAAAMAGHDSDAAAAHFADHMAGFDGANSFDGLARPAPHPKTPASQRDTRARAMGADLLSALRARAARADATVATVLHVAYGVVLARWTGQGQATFGVTQAGFTAVPGARQMAGCLIATHPIHLPVTANLRLDDALRRLRAAKLGHRKHHFADAAQIRAASGLTSSEKLFDTVLSVAPAALGQMVTDPYWTQATITLHEQGGARLTLAVHLAPDLELVLEYDPGLLSDAQADRFLDHVARVLHQIAASPEQALLSDLDMLAPEERARLLDCAQPTVPAAPATPCIAARFADIAARNPTAPAVTCARTGATLSYQALADRALAIAQGLVARGIGPGAIVALDMARSTDFVASMLAVWRVGAAFLPLDPGQDTGLKARLTAQARAALVLGPPLAPSDDADQGVARLDPAALPDHPDAAQPVPPLPQPDAARLAYVIFTSGSTGTPKGVMGACGALSAHADAMIAAFGLTPSDTCLGFAGLAFDVALEETVPTLLSGAHLVLRDDESAQSLAAFRALVARHAVTVLNLPASFWHVLVDDMAGGGAPLAPSVRLVITGSERINPDALARWQKLAPTLRWMNGYGPTEATITCAAFDLPPGSPAVDPARDVPVGRPLGHATCHVRAADGSLAPEGAVGTLWVGGPAVTLGYLDRPDATAEVFQTDPFAPGGRIYNTGDRARWRSDGLLEFLGRRDRQVKLRGHRIDLNGVERALAGLPGIRQAHVALDRPGTPQARLLGWLLPQAGEPPLDLPALRAQLARQLPLAAIPTLVPVTDLPVTPNGKIATAALPRPDLPVAAQVTSTDALTNDIGRMMGEVLALDHVGPDDDFYDVGGDSLAAVRFVSVLESRLKRRVAAMDLYQNPTPAAFADFLRNGLQGSRYIVPIQPEGTKPAFFAVHVLGPRESQWRPLSDALGPDWPFFGITVGAPRTLDEIDIPAIARVYFDEIQKHHPDGPLMLGATSMASYYAYELAQLLVAAGRDVRLLVAFDAMGPGGRPPLQGAAKLRAHLRQFLRHGTGHLRAIAQARAIKRSYARDGAQSADGEVTGFNIIEATAAAVDRYQPAPYPAPMLVLRADTSFWDSPQALDSALGWASVAQGGVRMEDVPGEHLTILEPGNVAVLARTLQRVIAEQGLG